MSPPALLSGEDVTDFVLLQGHGAKGLAATGLDTLPDKYVQPADRRLDASRMVNGREGLAPLFPVIDVSNWESPSVRKSVAEAAERWGFFQIVGHGIPPEMLETVKETAVKFFEMPAEEKRKCLPEAGQMGWGSSFNPGVETVYEWHDFLSLLHVPGDDSVSDSWPYFCREVLRDYESRCEDILRNILSILLQNLNVTHIDEPKSRLFIGSLRVNSNYYPVCPNPDLAVGVGRHTDISSPALLLQDDTGGLYARVSGQDEEATWVHVEPTSGAPVINVGDALEICSNGRYQSVEHYVVPNRNKDRISVLIFANPASDAVLGPLPEVLETDPKPLYKQVVLSDYFNNFLGKARVGKEAIEYAKIKNYAAPE